MVDVGYTENCRFERIGTEIVKHELNYIDKEKEHPIFVKARQFYLHKQWNKAKHEYKKLLSINPNNAGYHHSYSCILSRFQGKDIIKILKKAQKHSDIAIKLDPSNIHMRLSHIQFLTDLQEIDKVHEQFKIVFNQLFAINIHDDINEITLNPKLISNAFDFYSRFLFVLCEHEDAVKYLQTAIAIKKKFGLDIAQRLQQDLAQFYLKIEEIPKALHQISMMEEMNEKSVWEKFQALRPNDTKPWSLCKGEIYLLIQNYKTAYKYLKYEFQAIKRDNTLFSNLIIYSDLIECCIELKKFEEADTLDNELYNMYMGNPSILKQSSNKNIYWARECLVGYYWIKKGGINNAIKAVKHLEYTTKCVLELNMKKMGNRMPSTHYYLGLAYKNLSSYKNKQYYIFKAKEALFQSAHKLPMESKYIWQFVMILFEEGKEWYLLKKYAKKSWKRCKEIKCISNLYPIMKKKWKEQIKRLKCSCCGNHKYLQSKKERDKLKVCKGCHSVFYCNIKCQKRDWKKSHSKQCNKIWIEWNKNLFKTIDNFNQFIPFNQLISEYSLINALI